MTSRSPSGHDETASQATEASNNVQRYFEQHHPTASAFDATYRRNAYGTTAGLFAGGEDAAAVFQREAAHAAALGIMTSHADVKPPAPHALSRHNDMFYGGLNMTDAAAAAAGGSFPLTSDMMHAQGASFLANADRCTTLTSINAPYFGQQFFTSPPQQQPQSSSSDISPNSAASSGGQQQLVNAYGAHMPTVSQTSTLRAYSTSAVGLAAAAAAAMPSTVAAHSEAIDTDPRELERFAEHFKQRRIKLGVTQADVGKALAHLKMPGVGSLSQSTICRFESLTLSHNNMVALKPILHSWLEKAEEAFKVKELGDGALAYIVQSGILPNMEKKRKRTSIAAPEKRSLEAYFALQPRPSGEKIAAIAEKLDLKKNVVRVWFCNQRQKQKRWAERHQHLHPL